MAHQFPGARSPGGNWLATDDERVPIPSYVAARAAIELSNRTMYNRPREGQTVPIYEYNCEKCGKFEFLHAVGEGPLRGVPNAAPGP